MKPSESEFLQIRGLRYHLRSWGRQGAPKLFMIHGWMDVSASFQFLVDALKHDWHVLAPDWRGYGLSQWTGGDTYWYGDFLADLDQLLAHFQPEAPVNLIAHSFGGNVACAYAGIRPERISRLVNIDAFGAQPTQATDMPRRYKRWMNRITKPHPHQYYDSYAELEGRLQRSHPRIPHDRIAFIARHWGKPSGDGRIMLMHDPAHASNAGVHLSNRLDDSMVLWSEVTAPTLILLARQGGAITRKADLVPGATAEDRFGCFRNRREVWFEDTGHMMHLERPGELAPVIEDFILNGMALRR